MVDRNRAGPGLYSLTRTHSTRSISLIHPLFEFAPTAPARMLREDLVNDYVLVSVAFDQLLKRSPSSFVEEVEHEEKKEQVEQNAERNHCSL